MNSSNLNDIKIEILNVRETKKWLVEFLEGVSDEDANYNSDRIQYFAYQLLLYFKSNCTKKILVDVFKKTMQTYVNESVRNEVFQDTFDFVTSHQKSSIVKNILSCLIVHLAINKYITIPFNALPSINRKIYTSGNIVFDSLPFSYRFFCYTSTPGQFRESKDKLTREQIDAVNSILDDDTATVRYKSWAGSSSALRRLVLYYGLKELDEISVEWLIRYKVEEAKHNSTRSFLPILDAVSIINNDDMSLSDNYRYELSKIDLNINRNRSSIHGDDFKEFKGKEAYDLSGVKDGVVLRECNENRLSVDGWSITKDEVVNYSPMRVDVSKIDSYWISTQKDYLNNGGLEFRTQKGKARNLAYLNAYIYSYLPAYFSRNDPAFPYPKEIKDFHSYIYVAANQTLYKYHYQNQVAKLPITLIDFIAELNDLSEDDIFDASARKNAARDAVSEIRRYFDYVLAKYSTIDECRIASNPISSFDRTGKGTKLSSSNKKRMDYTYWFLFKEYLEVLTDELLKRGENATGDCESQIVDVNKSVTFIDKTLNIKSVDMSPFACVSIYTGDRKAKILPYQQILALTLMSSSGLRLSNVMWLDARTFDKYMTGDLSDTDFCEVYVNTDKTKDNPFESAATVSVLKLCQRAKELRYKLVGITNKPIYYQGYKKSKWGKIIPLLQYTMQNTYEQIQSEIAQILYQFENNLKKSGVEFESEIMYCPRHLRTKQFVIAKRNRIIDNSPFYVDYLDGEGRVPFTSVRIGTEITPHSLRKTFDSFYNILTDPKTVGELFTGQTEAVVGYYTENTPHDELEVKRIAKALDLPNSSVGTLLSVSKLQKDDGFIQETLKEQGLNGIGGFTVSPINDKDINVDQILDKASKSDIAVNWTHICPYDNECPPHIYKQLGQSKRCAICPVSISTKGDAPAIAAKIKQKSDRVADINDDLESDGLLSRERDDLIKERYSCVSEATDWLIRLRMINKLIDDDGIVAQLDDSQELKRSISYIKPGTFKKNILTRLVEVDGVPGLQSSRLKNISERLSRKMLSMITDGNFYIPETNQVEVAVGMIKKIANTHQVDLDELSRLLSEYDDGKYLRNNDLALEVL